MHGNTSRLFLAAVMLCGLGASRLGQIPVIKYTKAFPVTLSQTDLGLQREFWRERSRRDLKDMHGNTPPPFAADEMHCGQSARQKCKLGQIRALRDILNSSVKVTYCRKLQSTCECGQ